MMPFLIATALTCAEVSEMIDRLNAKKNLSASIKADIVEVYKEYLVEAEGLDCTWDAND
tara:strand:- start:613 stop:789 length:177 start_codon:yes stop_codon:yes gene_type:complete